MKISPRGRWVSSRATRARDSSSCAGMPANTEFPPRNAAISSGDIGGRIARGLSRDCPGGAAPAPQVAASGCLQLHEFPTIPCWHLTCKATGRGGRVMRRIAGLLFLGLMTAMPDRAGATPPIIDGPTVLERSPAAIQASLGEPVRTKTVPPGDFRLRDGGMSR